jgi:hypothetical protein
MQPQGMQVRCSTTNTAAMGRLDAGHKNFTEKALARLHPNGGPGGIRGMTPRGSATIREYIQ